MLKRAFWKALVVTIAVSYYSCAPELLSFSQKRNSEGNDIFIVGEEKGYALAIGLNAVDPNHYDGWRGKLNEEL